MGLFVVPKTISAGSTPSPNVIDALRATLYFPFCNKIIISLSSLYLSKPRIVGSTMDNINITNVQESNL
jgi:hypothetical protein